MNPTITAVQVFEPNDLRLIQIPMPEIDPVNNVLVRIRAAGICGSDIAIYQGKNAAATYPRIIGHEMVGDVVQTGPGAEGVKVGDRVIIDQVTACGTCYACRKGRPNVCRNLRVRGVHIDGGYREYMAVPAKDCYQIPDSLRYEDAVLIEPTTIAVQACSRAELASDDELLIYGYGALGTRMLSIARLYGCRIIVADIDDQKLKEALAAGADYAINTRTQDLARCLEAYTTDGYGPTVSIDCACTKDSLQTLLEVTGNAGRVITMGFSSDDTAVKQFTITSKELDVRGSRLQNRKFQEVIDLVREGKVDLDHQISHSFPLAQAEEAFRFATSGDPTIRKIVLVC